MNVQFKKKRSINRGRAGSTEKTLDDIDIALARYDGDANFDSTRPGDRLLFLLMLHCGLRVCEACSLTWNDIDLEAASIRINDGKGQVDRVVYIAPDVEKSLQLWHRLQLSCPRTSRE